jgi:hypothetical protein
MYRCYNNPYLHYYWWYMVVIQHGYCNSGQYRYSNGCGSRYGNYQLLNGRQLCVYKGNDGEYDTWSNSGYDVNLRGLISYPELHTNGRSMEQQHTGRG